MPRIVPIRGVSPLRATPDMFERRRARLERRLLHARAPIVWLCAGAGCGKTRLLDSVRASVAGQHLNVLDDPSPAALARELAAVMEDGQQRRLLVASRAKAESASLLLRPHAYGVVDTLLEAELFVRAEDILPAQAELLSATGGWPWLIAAALAGRDARVRALLPEFLEREVLPHLEPMLTAALFAAAATPLPDESLEGIDLDCGLLVKGSAGYGIAGDWVRTALLSLRCGSAARAPRVREHLMALYARLADPAPAIGALLDLGDRRGAFELFRRAGGAYYGYTHGFPALERVLARFGPDAAQHSEDIFLAHLWVLLKTGKTREAFLRLEARHPGLPVDLRRLRASHRPELLLLRADMALDLDDTPSPAVIASWGRLQTLMAPGDELSRGILYNTMALGYLYADGLVEARQLAEEALAAYERAGMPYLVHFMHVHLAEIALRQCRLTDVSRHIERAERMLGVSGQAFNSEYAILESLKSRLAFEQGRFEDCAEEITPLLEALLGGDSWPDLIPRMASQVVLVSLWRTGLRSALAQLDRCTLAQNRRHGVMASRRLLLIRIRVLQAARRHAEAGALLEEYEIAGDTEASAALELESGLVRLRQTLERDGSRAQRARLESSLAQHPALETRQRITLALLEAAGRQRDGAEAMARRHLRIALREAEAQDLVAVLIEDGECLERLLPAFIAAPGPGHARLASFAASVLKRLKSLPTTPLRSKALAGLSRQEHHVLCYVADGYSNKQTARALGLSESTVKFHLRHLFTKLGVASRNALGETARTRGIIT